MSLLIRIQPIGPSPEKRVWGDDPVDVAKELPGWDLLGAAVCLIGVLIIFGRSNGRLVS
jgi:hypothetical protein